MSFGQNDSAAIDSIKYFAIKKAIEGASDNDGTVKCLPMNIYKGMTQYTAELENVAAQIPLLNEEIITLRQIKVDSRKEIANRDQQISLLQKNADDWQGKERKYLQEIANVNVERTDMQFKLKRRNKTIFIVAGVGALCVTGLMIPLIILAQ